MTPDGVAIDPATGVRPPRPYALTRMEYCLAWEWKPWEWDSCPTDTLLEWLWMYPRWRARLQALEAERYEDHQAAVSGVQVVRFPAVE